MYQQPHPFNPDKFIPVIPVEKSYTSYMSVEAVLRYMKRNALALQQYTMKGVENHFFLCKDVATKMTPAEFREMECHVTQYMVEIK